MVKNPTFRHTEIEKAYFAKLNTNMLAKSLKRIEEIKLRIMNDLIKGSFNKNYQVRSHIEYWKLRAYLVEKGFMPNDYEFLWQHGPEKTSKLDRVIEGNYYCCQDCDRPLKFVNKSIPVIYCYWHRKRLFGV